MKVSLVNVQAPFVRGGAEYLADSVAERIRQRGHEVDHVKIPFKWYPLETVMDHMLACRLLDVHCDQSDLVISFKFPAYLVPAPRKKVWLFHQFRQVYEMWEREVSTFDDNAANRAVRETIHSTDNQHLSSLAGLFSNSHTVANRLRRYNAINVDAVLYPPLDRPELYQPVEYGDYFFYPSRVTGMKRQHIAVEAMRHVRSPFKLVIAGQADSAAYGATIENLITKYRLQNKVVQLGWVTEEVKAHWMNRAFAALYLPYDEDSYGFVTVEAFSAHKAVISFTDSGGVSELVTHEKNGLLVEPTPESLAGAMESLWANRSRARELGAAGNATLSEHRIDWNYILDVLLS